jgi:hypothetical protein
MKYKKGDLVWLQHHEGNPAYIMKITGSKFDANNPPRGVGDEPVYWVVIGKESKEWGQCGENSMVELTALDRVIYT